MRRSVFSLQSTLSLAAGLGLLVAAGPSLAQEAPRPTTFLHPLGFSMSLPAGWKTVPGEGHQVVLAPPDVEGAEGYILSATAAPGLTRISDPEAVRSAEADMAASLPALRRVGPVETFRSGLGEAVRLSWGAILADGTEVRATVYSTLLDGNALVLMAIGERSRVAAREAALQNMVASFAPSKGAPAPVKGAAPAAAGALDDGSETARQWRQRLAGKKLTRLSSYSSGSSGGYSSQSELRLKADGTFHYWSSSSVSVYVDGASGGSAGRDEDAGRWKVVSRGGAVLLVVTSDRGGTAEFRLTFSDGKTFLNGARTFVTD